MQASRKRKVVLVDSDEELDVAPVKRRLARPQSTSPLQNGELRLYAYAFNSTNFWKQNAPRSSDYQQSPQKVSKLKILAKAMASPMILLGA